MSSRLPSPVGRTQPPRQFATSMEESMISTWMWRIRVVHAVRLTAILLLTRGAL